VARRLSLALFAGAGIACAAAISFRTAALPLVLVAGAAGGVGVAAAVRVGRGPLTPIGDVVRAAPEVERVLAKRFEIFFRIEPRRGFARYTFVARHRGRQLGRLDADFIPAESRLYAHNVFVAEPRRKHGLATALPTAAALTTGCSVVTSSARTRAGAALCVRARPALKRHGVELRDDPP
jgi:hypothetical protein